MVWKESEVGTWLDDLDGAERVFYNMSQAFAPFGKEHGSVYSVCKIRALPSTTAIPLETLIRDAWEALRFDFPALSVVVEGSKKKYVAATAERRADWIEETFSIITSLSANEIIPTLHLKRLPRLIFLPQSSEIIFHCSHWRIDALGTCMILNRLLDLVSEGVSGCCYSQDWALEYLNLSPSLEDAFGSPQTCSPAMEAMAETIRRRNFETSYPSTGLPFKGDRTTPPAVSRPREMKLTLDATKVLIAACKTRAVSVTAAIHAACADMVFQQSNQNEHDYTTVVSANMRNHLVKPQRKTKAAYACGTYVTGITHIVRRGDDFATRSSQLTNAYRGDWQASEYMNALRPIYKVHGDALLAVAKSGIRPPASNVTVSSLGVVDKYLRSDHRSVLVESFRLGSAIMTRQPTLYIWTFQGRLTISVDYNEAYYSAGTIETLLSGIKGCLEGGLGLATGLMEEA
ncbi:MAG: hypothetical protein OHK93_007358 [Ramalina farinacea]|uniref:Alcohol acetyltransferase n=1 Tax=Ramalina farinacea TaxID=258253 RepID=A0AA43TUA8_9LECA|nr:hypothetical protein [Ramalina farinacea]